MPLYWEFPFFETRRSLCGFFVNCKWRLNPYNLPGQEGVFRCVGDYENAIPKFTDEDFPEYPCFI